MYPGNTKSKKAKTLDADTDG